jgi:ABC-type multidrug transport system ATPase subunit
MLLISCQLAVSVWFAEMATDRSFQVAARGITKSFRRRTVLRNVDCEVHAGEIIALVGENGTGKTTLLRIIAGLIGPDTGSVSVTGPVGYCPQEPGVFDLLTAEEHLILFGRPLGLCRDDALARGWRVLDRLGFPSQEYRTVCRELSGGTRQKLNLSLALFAEPPILLLDEPYQGFDRGSYVDFWEAAAQWREERRAVLVVTHLLTEIERVDRVIELTAAACSVGAGDTRAGT